MPPSPVPASSRPRLAVSLSHLGGWSRPAQADLVTLARVAEEAGVDQLVLSEHVALAQHMVGHPGARPGDASARTFPFPADEEYPEPLVALAALAVATSRVRLSTNILIAPLRPAVLLAKMAATVDALSGGRLDLGVGIGWLQQEFDAVGVPSAGLAARMDDTVGACRALWAGGPSSFASATVSFDDLYCSPVPIQSRLPVFFGGRATPATARRVVGLGDGWSVIGGTAPAEIAKGRLLIDEEAVATGRDPRELTIRCSLAVRTDDQGRADIAATVASAEPFLDAGAGIIQLPALGAFVRHPDEVGPLLRRAVATFSALTQHRHP